MIAAVDAYPASQGFGENAGWRLWQRVNEVLLENAEVILIGKTPLMMADDPFCRAQEEMLRSRR